MSSDHTPRAIEVAMRRGRESGRTGGIFYCDFSGSLRQWPQNYRLAVQSLGEPSVFLPAPDKASTINGHSLAIALRQHADASTPEALADELTTAFYGPLCSGA